MRIALTVLPAVLALPLAAGLLPAQDASSTDKAASSDKIEPFELGAKVSPDIALPGIDGKTYRLGDFAGKPLVLDFWSIQCPWSIKYEKTLLELHAEYKAKGITFLAINANHREVDWDAEKPYARIQEYVDETKVTYPILIDEGNLVADLFGGRTTPHIFILDGKGHLAYRGGIDDNPKGDPDKDTTRYVADALDALLAGKAVEKADTKALGCSIKRVNKDRIQ